MSDENYKRAVENFAKLLRDSESQVSEEVLGILVWDLQYLRAQPQYGKETIVH